MNKTFKTLGLVVAPTIDERHANLLDKSRFFQRILATVDSTVIYGATGPQELERVKNISEVIQISQAIKAEVLVLLHCSQLFFDPEVIFRGLTRLSNMDNQWHYFTQWEHCRLPIGIGARILNMQKPEIFQNDLELNEMFTPRFFESDIYCRYDDNIYVNREYRILDSRYSPNSMLSRYVDKNILQKLSQGSSPMNTFLSIADEHTKEMRLMSQEKGNYFDDRGIVAPIGFESRDCADFPTYIMFDVTNICNAKCIHCPQSTMSIEEKGKPKHLSWENYTKVIDECVDRNLDIIRVTADGEPLLHPYLVEMLEYASSNGVGPIGLTTNGMLMTEEVANRILDAGLFMVDFSVDAASQQTYSRIRQGLKFEKVIQNIHNFIKIRNEMKSECKVMVSFVEQEANRHELEDFKRYWKEIADKVLIRSLITNVNMVDCEEKVPKNIQRFPCPHPFRRVVVTYDGRYKYCPVDWNNKTCVGNVSDTTIEDIWHGDGYHIARLEHLNLEFEHCDACRDCPDWQGSPWKYGYEKVMSKLK